MAIDPIRANLQRLINLAHHPLFREQPELPAWEKAIKQAEFVLAESADVFNDMQSEHR